MKRVRFIEPMSGPRSVFNRYIRDMPLIGPGSLAEKLRYLWQGIRGTGRQLRQWAAAPRDYLRRVSGLRNKSQPQKVGHVPAATSTAPLCSRSQATHPARQAVPVLTPPIQSNEELRDSYGGE